MDGPVRGTVVRELPEGRWQVIVDLIPTYADADGAPLQLILRIDGRDWPLSIPRETGNAAWAQAVLDNRISVDVPTVIESGRHRFELLAESGGVLIEAVRFVPADR